MNSKQNTKPYPVNRSSLFQSLFIPIIFLALANGSVYAQNIFADTNSDGLANNPGTVVPPPSNQFATVNDCVRIGLVQTGGYTYIDDRFDDLGYNDYTIIAPESGLSTLEEYDIIYLSTGWASASNPVGDYETIENLSDDYIAYVAGGGALYVEQPNPFQQPGSTVTPSILPYPITFYNTYNSNDHPPLVVEPNHEIVAGINPDDMSLPADQMTSIDDNYEVLVRGSVTMSPCLAILEYGAGRILVSTANSASVAINPLSDEYFGRMLAWLSTSVHLSAPIAACDEYTWIDGITYTESNNTASFTFVDAAGCDSVVVLNLTINSSSTTTDVITSCGAYTWIDGNVYISDNNTSSFTVPSSNGCDSLVYLDLTIEGPDVTIIEDDLTLTVTEPNATYQWLDCDSGYVPIPGATAQSYSASANGSYAVAVTLNECTDTSACSALVVLSGVEDVLLKKVSVYPNPSAGQLMIDFGKLEQPTVKMYTVLGQLVFEKQAISERLFEFELGEVSGVYFVEVLLGSGRKVFRVVRE